MGPGLSNDAGGDDGGGVPWRCPHCANPLCEDERGARCERGHVFDRAREGYLNLRVGGRLPGAPAGDSGAMLRARRALFDAGHYAPVLRAVAEMAIAREPKPAVVLDAGCGEGSYLAAIDAPTRLGIDIAKDGVRMAARRHRDVRWAVASSYRLPLADDSVDVVVSVFAPRPFGEFGRVARPGGVAVIASPGPDHLDGLTTLIYGAPRPHEQRTHAAGGDARDDAPLGPPVARQRVRYRLALTSANDVGNLLQMTPYWWQASEAQRHAISARDELATIVDVIVTAHTI